MDRLHRAHDDEKEAQRAKEREKISGCVSDFLHDGSGTVVVVVQPRTTRVCKRRSISFMNGTARRTPAVVETVTHPKRRVSCYLLRSYRTNNLAWPPCALCLRPPLQVYPCYPRCHVFALRLSRRHERRECSTTRFHFAQGWRYQPLPLLPTEQAMPTAKGRALFGEEDCERPACDDVRQNLPKSMEEVQAMTKKLAAKKKVECPPRSAELGRSSWKLLHAMAAWYPDNPTVNEQKKMTNFFQALSLFYPCVWCAEDFQQQIEKTPPATETRNDLCLWLCDQHNRVNKKLGKPLFECTMENLDERWRKSTDPKCSHSR